MQQDSIFNQLYIQPATQYRLKVTAESLDLLSQFTEIFAHADDVVGAQFYYTNPILYVLLLPDEDMEHHACLYGNYYLLHIRSWETLEMAHDVIAVNQNFLDDIGSAEDTLMFNITELEKYHNEHGLYLVGIKID